MLNRLELINELIQQTAIIGGVGVTFQLVDSITDQIIFPRIPTFDHSATAAHSDATWTLLYLFLAQAM